MARVRPKILSDALLAAIQESGARATLLSRTAENPRRFLVDNSDEIADVWVYARPLSVRHEIGWGEAHEFRLLPGFRAFRPNPSGPTLAIGYDPDSGLFAGFDTRPIVERKRCALACRGHLYWAGKHAGFALHKDAKGRVTAVFASHQLSTYLWNQETIHNWADVDSEIFSLLNDAPGMDRVPIDRIIELPPEKRKEVKKAIKDILHRNFQKKVREAYKYKCALTGSGVPISDAAHIYPARYDDSNYNVTNGIMLRADLHRAFDSGILYMGDDFKFRFDWEKPHKLPGNAGDGLEYYKDFHMKHISLPELLHERPDIDMIKKSRSANGVFRRKVKTKRTHSNNDMRCFAKEGRGA